MSDAIGIAGTGLTVHQQWLNAISDNIANIDTAEPMSGSAFQARYITAQAGAGDSGVYVTGAAFGSAQGIVTYDPENPEANAQGYVRMPDIDLSEQMGDLIMAQRGYQANADVIERAESTYQSALQIGQKIQ